MDSEEIVRLVDKRVKDPTLEELAQLLFKKGGRKCYLCADPNNHRIYNEGKLLINHYRREEGKPRFCHENSFALHNTKGYRLFTGYANCIDENAWLRHSWCMDKKHFIVETSHNCNMYFGLELTEMEFFEMLFNYSSLGIKFWKEDG